MPVSGPAGAGSSRPDAGMQPTPAALDRGFQGALLDHPVILAGRGERQHLRNPAVTDSLQTVHPSPGRSVRLPDAGRPEYPGCPMPESVIAWMVGCGGWSSRSAIPRCFRHHRRIVGAGADDLHRLRLLAGDGLPRRWRPW